MSSYAQIILDTLAPSGVSVTINNGENKTSSTAASLSITCSDSDLTGYQMKIWGISGAETEDSALWETYQTSKTVTLTPKDGMKTVYVKVRDDVWNESTIASGTITLFTTIPTVSGFVFDNSKLSLVDKKNRSIGGFQFDEPVDAVKIMIVDSINATHNASTNISIPVTNGSWIYDEEKGDAIPGDTLECENYAFPTHTRYIEFSLMAADIVAASPGDGVKLIKAFVRSAASGNWSV